MCAIKVLRSIRRRALTPHLTSWLVSCSLLDTGDVQKKMQHHAPDLSDPDQLRQHGATAWMVFDSRFHIGNSQP